MRRFEPDCNQPQDTYSTGSTNPPRSYQGIIAVLLILVIILGSIVTVLGMMNIRMFQLLEQQASSSLQFSPEKEGNAENAAPQAQSEGVAVPALGLTGEEITSLYRSYNDWPQGLYVSQVEPEGPAAKADIRCGDILVAINGISIASEDDFRKKTAVLRPGDTLQLTVFREDSQITVPLTAAQP